MVGYKAIEAAVVSRFLAYYPNELSATRCKGGDMDAVFDAIFSENKDYGAWFEFGGGKQRQNPAQTKNHWVWTIVGVFAIRFRDDPEVAGDDIETKLRNVMNLFPAVFDADRTLGGKTPLVELVDLGSAEPAKVNDLPFYWVPFVIEAFDR